MKILLFCFISEDFACSHLGLDIKDVLPSINASTLHAQGLFACSRNDIKDVLPSINASTLHVQGLFARSKNDIKDVFLLITRSKIYIEIISNVLLLIIASMCFVYVI